MNFAKAQAFVSVLAMVATAASCGDLATPDCDAIQAEAAQSAWIREERDKIREILRELQSSSSSDRDQLAHETRSEALKRQLGEIVPGTVSATTEGQLAVDTGKAEEEWRRRDRALQKLMEQVRNCMHQRQDDLENAEKELRKHKEQQLRRLSK